MNLNQLSLKQLESYADVLWKPKSQLYSNIDDVNAYLVGSQHHVARAGLLELWLCSPTIQICKSRHDSDVYSRER